MYKSSIRLFHGHIAETKQVTGSIYKFNFLLTVLPVVKFRQY